MSTARHRRSATRRAQGGAALLTAMIIVTMIATITVGMVWQQWRSVQVEAAERTQIQARWVLDGTLDWTRLILREDARAGGPDHLGEPWAVELKEARLSTFLAADKDNNVDDAPDAFLSGQIRDAQARFNINNLIRDGKFQPKDAASLAKLCELAGSSNLVAQQIINAVRAAHPEATAELTADSNGNAVNANAGPATGSNAPLLPSKVSQLTWIGLDATTVALLEPFFVFLPSATPVNINTAPKEVLAAVVTNGDLASAQRLVLARVRTPFKTVEEARVLLGLKDPLDETRASIKTRYFEVDGSLRLDQLIVTQRSLLERAQAGIEVRVLHTERIVPTRKPANLLQP